MSILPSVAHIFKFSDVSPRGVAEMIGFLREATAQVGASFTRPDADWEMMLFLSTTDAFRVVHIEPLGVKGREKEAVITGMQGVVAQYRPRAIGLVMSAWVAKGTLADYVRVQGKASLIPGREERLLIQASDGERLEVEFAPIIRGDKPPRLGEWSPFPIDQRTILDLRADDLLCAARRLEEVEDDPPEEPA